jgi:hypothetical protein
MEICAFRPWPLKPKGGGRVGKKKRQSVKPQLPKSHKNGTRVRGGKGRGRAA